MDHVKTIKAAYKYSLLKRCYIRFCCLCYKKKNKMLDLREIDKSWPNPHSAISPDNIIWKNMGISNWNRFVRMFFQWLFATSLLIAAFYALFKLSSKQTYTDE